LYSETFGEINVDWAFVDVDNITSAGENLSVPKELTLAEKIGMMRV